MHSIFQFSLIAILLLCPIVSAAQEATERPQKQRKSLRQIIATSDSLRLRMRYAADHGYMLQWADTLVREKIRSGEMDSTKYRKYMKRLARLDRTFYRGDSLLARKYNKVKFDTNYIARPDARWTVKLRGNISNGKLTTLSREGGEERQTVVRSEVRGTLSLAVAYRGLGLGIALNPAKLAGKSKDFEYNLNSYGNKFGFDIVYLDSKTYQGHQTTDCLKTSIEKGTVSQRALNLNAYYAFNGRRFSFPAAFSQSYIQKRSAGSWMIGASFDGSRTEIKGSEEQGTKDTRISISDLAIGIGYGYNLVASRHWLLHLSALPTYTIYSHDNITVDGQRTSMKHALMSGIVVGRGAAVYSWRNKFAGATMVYNYSFAGQEKHLQVRREKWRVRAFFGFRF